MDYKRFIELSSRFLSAVFLTMVAGSWPLLEGAMINSVSARSSSQTRQELFDHKDLTQAIQLSAKYLNRACNQDGKFLYRVNLNPNLRPKPKYNFLRHAGSIYALADYDREHPGSSTLNTLERATGYLKKTAIYPIPDRNDLLAVWSRAEFTGSQIPLQAKLGGTGLGLIALLSVEKRKPETTTVNFLRKMGNFIIFMQKTDGSFYSKYIPEKGGKDDSWTSLYYPGEAALGLLMLYEKDPAQRWLQAAANAIAYLARLRAGRRQVEADHWALLATAKLLPLYDRCQQPLPKSEIMAHAIRICESILTYRSHNSKNTPRHGCLTDDGRTTPTAIRLEGLLAAHRFLPAEHRTLRERIRVTAREGIAFLIRSQIPSGKYTGGIPRAIHPLPINHPRFDKSFNDRATEVRIDYVQHALSAMLDYREQFF
ncbi:MAG: hypothetical protein PVG87_10060 [Desulfobacteraceae bacterium]|jgi:hypothetical protein